MQGVYDHLDGGYALKLTTGKWFTPSGRSIQRPRKFVNGAFVEETPDTNETNATKKSRPAFKSDAGRTVYGGGGITPDERYTCASARNSPGNPYICSTPDKFDKFQVIALRNNMFNFTASYFGPKTDASLPKGWEPDEAIVNKFHDYLLDKKVDFTEADFTANHDWLKRELRNEMYITAFSFEDSERVAIESDPEVLKALDSMAKARGLVENAKKLLVQRINAQGPQRGQ